MSTYYSIRCLTHKVDAEDSIKGGDEVERIKNLWLYRYILKTLDEDITFIGIQSPEYNENSILHFCIAHRECEAEVFSEYGKTWPLHPCYLITKYTKKSK